MSYKEENGSPDQLDAASQNGDGQMGDGQMGDGENLDADGEIPFANVAEGKKFAVSTTTMLMLGVLGLGALGVWFMVHRISAANAAPLTTETAQAKKTINAFLDTGGASMRNMETMLRSTEKIVQQFLNYPSMTQIPLSDLHINPFRLRAPHVAVAASDAAEKRKLEEQRVAMLKSVQALQLQSIMYSDTRKACLINNAMYREGQTVDVFTIDKITASSVVVKSGVYRFELRMQK